MPAHVPGSSRKSVLSTALKLTDAGQNMYSMGENAANRSDKLPACRQRG